MHQECSLCFIRQKHFFSLSNMGFSLELLFPKSTLQASLDSHGGSLRLNLLDVTHHVEGTLWKIVIASADNLLESLDGILKAHELSSGTSENLSNMEWLTHELLNLTGPAHNKLIILRQLIHTKNGNDILQSLVILEELLGGTSNLVVLVSDHSGIKHTGGGVKRIDSGVDTQLSNGTGKHSGGIQVCEGGSGGRIRKIISRHVDSLDGGNGSLGSGGNTLLKPTHISGKSRLVTDSGRNTSQKGGHLRTGLGETEDIVNEEQHILSLLITEVLGNGQSSKGDTGTGSRGLVHLPVHKGSLGALSGSSLVINLDDTSLNHLVVEIVTLTGTFTNTSEDGVSSVVHGNVVDKLHDNDSLSDTGSTEETNLTSLGVGSQKVNNLDTRDQNLLTLTLLSEGGCAAVEGSELGGFLVGKDGSLLIDGLTNDVDDTSQGLGADRHLDGLTGVSALLATDKSVGGLHGNGTHGVLSKMLGDLKDKTLALGLNLKSVENLGKLLIELNIHNGTNDLGDLSHTGDSGGAAEGAGATLGNETSSTGSEHGLSMNLSL
mmetsp:Transcript_20622/g.35423  ORF Transcript_20622/g.35423 Transcript_20622/m.35423 type:complete len:548 (+) Transcript_20622:132-1775(+)